MKRFLLILGAAAWLLLFVFVLGQRLGVPRTFAVGEWVIRERVLTIDQSRAVVVESFRWCWRKGHETRIE